MLLTRSPLSNTKIIPEGTLPMRSVRLACVRRAASVRPEPGSNSLVNGFLNKLSPICLKSLKSLSTVSSTEHSASEFTVKKEFFRGFLHAVSALAETQGSFSSSNIV